jgi:hypothetical protein
MPDLDLQGFHDDVTRILVETLYMRHGPAPMPGSISATSITARKEQAMTEYRNNPRFKTIVDVLSSAITKAAETRHR